MQTPHTCRVDEELCCCGHNEGAFLAFTSCSVCLGVVLVVVKNSCRQCELSPVSPNHLEICQSTGRLLPGPSCLSDMIKSSSSAVLLKRITLASEMDANSQVLLTLADGDDMVRD